MSHSDRERIVQEFIDSWELHETLRPGYERYLAEDCLWANTGLKPIRGRAAALALVDRSIETWGGYSVEGRCAHLVGHGEVVFVERRDIMKDGAGATFCDMPIAGVFEVRGAVITRWSDYYDPKPMFAAMNAAIEAKRETVDHG